MKSSSRRGARVRLVALHTTEGILRNEDLRAFFNRANAQGSSHAAADRGGLLESGFVPYGEAAWTLRSGNPISDNLEQCGFAKWTRDRWLTDEIGTINAAALWVRQRCTARGIPIRYLTHAQLRAGESGVIQHNDWSVAMKDGSHWDCGPNYPIDVVISKARAQAGSAAPGPAPTTRKDDMGLQNFPVPPTVGAPARMRLNCPTGKASIIVGRAWVSAAVNGDRPGSARVFAQSDTAGIADFSLAIPFVSGRSARAWRELPDGTTTINVQYDMPDGGVITLETEPK